MSNYQKSSLIENLKAGYNALYNNKITSLINSAITVMSDISFSYLCLIVYKIKCFVIDDKIYIKVF